MIDRSNPLAALIVGLVGVSYALTGLALIFAPQWFFATIGPFPPFSWHYEGDLGVFLLPLGIGLLWAATDLARHRLLIGIAAAGSLLHAGNHLYDALTSPPPTTSALIQIVLLFGVALLLLWP